MAIEQQLSDKRWLWIYQPGSANSLSFSELWVYSYLCYQDSYQRFPSALSIAAATGIHRETVAKTLDQLKSKGLITGSSVLEPPELFFHKKSSADASHFCRRWCNWQTLVRTPSSTLTLAATSFYSLLLYSQFKKWRLPNTKTGRAALLRISRPTLDTAVENLQDCKFLQSNGPKLQLFNELTDEQLAMFADRPVNEDEQPIEFVSPIVEDAETMEIRQVCSKLLNELKNRFPNDGAKQAAEVRRCFDIIHSKPDWRIPERQRQYVSDVLAMNGRI